MTTVNIITKALNLYCNTESIKEIDDNKENNENEGSSQRCVEAQKRVLGRRNSVTDGTTSKPVVSEKRKRSVSVMNTQRRRKSITEGSSSNANPLLTIRPPTLHTGTLTSTEEEGRSLLTTKEGSVYSIPSTENEIVSGTCKKYIGQGTRLFKFTNGETKKTSTEVVILMIKLSEYTKFCKLFQEDIKDLDEKQKNKIFKEVKIGALNSNIRVLKREHIFQNSLRGKETELFPKIYDIVEVGEKIFIATEPYSSDLLTHIENSSLTKEEKLIIAKGVLKGLALLHNNGMYHRDIKPENVLVRLDPETGKVTKAVLTDFGRACTSEEKENMQEKNCGHPSYQSYNFNSRLENDKPMTQDIVRENDLWGMGSIFREILLDLPFTEEVEGDQVALNEINPKDLKNAYPEPKEQNSLEHITWDLMANAGTTTASTALAALEQLEQVSK